MANPRQMFDHTLDAIKGWFQMAALDFTAKISANVTVSVYAGRCAHINDVGEFELGCTGSMMPIFLLQNGTDNDVSNDGGTTWYPIGPTGTITGLVGSGSYELETTEFDSANTYAPNEYLRCKSSSQSSTDAGLLTNASTVAAEAGSGNPTNIVGVVSRGVRKRQSDRNNVLAFWTVYKPGKAGY
jgi:hypothetical protein